MLRALHRIVPLACAACVLVLPGRAAADIIVFSASGPDAASITSTVTAFRNALGNPNNANTPGPLAGGRREINWDGGGAATTISPTPFTGFLNIRGALFTTQAPNPAQAFVQAPPSGLATLFNNPTYANIFTTFSPQRDFSAIGNNVLNTTFFIPGTNGATPAAVSGFGAVFTDVDLANTSSISLFDPNGIPIGTFFVPPFDNGLSFLGLAGNAGERIGSVRITSGNTPLGPNDNPGGGVDVAALDDFLFGEPQAIPEPTSLALLGIGVLGLLGVRCCRRKRAA